MNAHIFDIDGTLLDSCDADSDLYAAAVCRVWGLPSVSTDWGSYGHVTDAGVLLEILRRHDIDPDPNKLAETEREFVALLEQHIADHGPFREVPGAVAFVSRLLASPHHFVAYATGGWRESALLKLRSAGFPTEGVRVSTSSEFLDRVSIMRSALSAAPAGINRITYYGDGVWDQVAVRELGWSFMPVGDRLDGLRHYYGSAVQDCARVS